MGYNDIPYLRRGHNDIGKAPVKTEVGFADGRPGYVQEAGDILWFLQNAQVGDLLVIPQYWGCNRDADIIYTFTNNGWSEAEYIDYRVS